VVDVDSTKAPEDRFHVVIVGGGIGALEGLLALRALAAERIAITLLAPGSEFRHRPLSVTEPFDLASPRRLRLADVADEARAIFIEEALAGIDTDRRRIETASGRELDYDAALLAIGARGKNSFPGALVFTDTHEDGGFRQVLTEVERGDARTIVFAVPPGKVWPLGLYELALLSSGHLRRREATDAELLMVTPESRPLGVFGPRASSAVGELLIGAGIELRVGSEPIEFHDGKLAIRDRAAIPCDHVVSLPVPEVTPIPGLPQQWDGFIPIGRYGRVLGAERLFAAGDATTFPVKQGGLAAQLADSAATAIAALAGAPVSPQPLRPVLRGALLTESGPRYMRTPLDDPSAGIVATSILWWPPAKVAGRHLAPYLSRPAEASPRERELEDLLPPPVNPPAGADAAHRDRVEAALKSADNKSGSGDYRGALHWLEVAEDLDLYLPSEYESKRAEWRKLAGLG
jgi:sulfide:quinone oxidoreductase